MRKAGSKVVGDTPTPDSEPSKLIAVLDSNVFMSLATCVDLGGLYMKGMSPTSVEAIYRRQRAREATLLSQYLHAAQAITYSLDEATRIVVERVTRYGMNTLEGAFSKVWLEYVRKMVVPDWKIGLAAGAAGEPRGSAADSLLVQHSQSV